MKSLFLHMNYGSILDLRGENRLVPDPRQHYFDKLIRSFELKLVRRENILFRVAPQGNHLFETLFVNIWTLTMSLSFLMAVVLFVWKCHKTVLSLFTLTLNYQIVKVRIQFIATRIEDAIFSFKGDVYNTPLYIFYFANWCKNVKHINASHF